MRTLRDGYDIRAYTPSACKWLLSTGRIAVISKDGVKVLTIVPKLALGVTSSVFRDYISLDGRDKMTIALGARLAYLCRNRLWPKHFLFSVQATLDRIPKVGNAVAAADARMKAKCSHFSN
ncbi:hypothetical protein CFE70_002523 [Pyrenophora teres f. teres 0-1]|uniref:Uncharacterized protein n=1 Tax=Pyrenophora teres f. teres TaxID=97479 RepID=A0A6S6VTM1_9PLEO|nr:hypothetical protein HRS9139_02376 [Pyrenophora teres f. teres]CAA9959003.1 hypothetical protein PTMSG1_02531 [Pyrenophora teres f. maculata]KAE8849863.1 hypothetical protein PTNB85_00279 [Pyrenophora teres f. teres]KAE8852110.1 hypothetical protein HRS9122_02397 [Pyrenophora teres f. teres]KAE8870781.1 hypothetical protein PTNB29_01125 [Pyrenophora teres f. teres]